MQKLLYFICCFTISYAVMAKGKVSGFITDAQTGEPLIGAHVYCPESMRGTTSNVFGYYVINIEENAELHFSYLGYTKTSVQLILRSDTVINVQLQQGIQLNEVSILAEKRIEERPEISTFKISMKDVKRLPALGGEVDLIKAMQLLPGVSQGNEGSSGMYVRGGSPDQNLMLLDDVPLYSVNHLGGFVSTFNPDAINNVTLIKGGFPARYGSRLSSVVDVRMKNGNMKEFKGNATIGLVSSKITIESPIKQDTSSYLISFRRMMYDILTRPITPYLFKGASMGYTFYDINAKYNRKFGTNNRVYFSFYSGDDKATSSFKDKEEDIKAKDKLKWGNTMASLRWNHVFNTKLFHNLTGYYTQYRNAIHHTYIGNDVNTEYSFLSKVSDAGIKSDYEYFASSAYTLRFGASGIYHHYKPTQINTRQNLSGINADSTMVNFTEQALEINAYVENEIYLGSKLNFNLGFRYNNYMLKEQNFASYEPRLALNYQFLPQHSIKVGYAQMQQNIHLLVGKSTGMPSDYWLPATNNLKPQYSTQYSVGWAHTTSGNNIEMSVEVYYKEMQNLISFEEGQSYFTGLDNWEEQVVGNGSGISKGIEFFIKKNVGSTTGWIGYTLSKTTRQFATQNNGASYPFRYDRTHDVSIVVQHKISRKMDVFATWVYNTGNAITLAKEQYIVPHEVKDEFENPYVKVEVYDGKNNTRMEAYHRLDVGVNLTNKTKHGEGIWRFSVYNLYNKQNAYFYLWSNDEDCLPNEKCPPKLYKQTLFPIIPSVSYSFTF